MGKKSAGSSHGRTAEAWFEMPFAVSELPLADHDLGIERPTLRGSAHSYTIDVTVLDTPDHRLIRSGVLLAHRVCDGLGDWYLNARQWAPPMPEELALPVDAEGDLPDELARLVRPFRRLAPLGPVAAVTLERNTYAIRGTGTEAGLVLATLRDDRFTIRRAGVAIGRVREVRLRPTPVMRPDQRAHIIQVLTATGGTRVSGFPDLRGRLGAPATGLTDIPEPRGLPEQATLEQFVSHLFGRRLRQVVQADLELRTDTTDSTEKLASELAGFRGELRGLGGVLEPSWRESIEDHLDVLAGTEASVTGAIREHQDRYMAVLDALVGAVRAPHLGDLSQQPASTTLQHVVNSQTRVVRHRCDALTAHSDDAAWAAALSAARQLGRTAAVVSELSGKAGRRLCTCVTEVVEALEPAVEAPVAPDAQQLDGMTTAQAFDAGRAHQRAMDAVLTAREAFVERWPTQRKHLKKALES